MSSKQKKSAKFWLEPSIELVSNEGFTNKEIRKIESTINESPLKSPFFEAPTSKML